MSLSAEDLIKHQGDVRRAQQCHHLCEDCLVVRGDGGAVCARHGGCCCACGSEDVAVRAEWHSDGVFGWWCQPCLDKEAVAQRQAEQLAEAKRERIAQFHAAEDERLYGQRACEQVGWGI